MSELGLPKTPSEVIAYIIWGVLVLGFGLEFCAAFVREEWWRALFSFAAMAGLAAMAYYSKDLKSWLANTSPNYVLPVFILVLGGLIFSPFVEQRRWPFASWFVATPAPSADEIAEAV